MAFTLAFHIILVPLGVSWAAMTLIANHRGLKHDDPDALRLAQRWSKYMAVTFAVGAVTGTVLSFEFGLLWPKFMGQWGDAFGVPFAFEGLFFFTEAIFVTIYIFGWRRLKPWTHFWTGVPIVVAGVFGSISVVAANAWMNSPSGFTLDSHGNITDVDPIGVIFNKAMPLQAAHMVVAAYLVGGFLVASVYAVGMLRGRTDRYHRLGFLIAFTVAAIATPVQMGVGDSLARWVYNNQPMKFAAIELVPETTTDVPETLLGHLNDDGTVSGGIPIPGLASWLSDPTDGTATVDPGPRLRAAPTTGRPTRQVNVVHLAWDVMVGLGTLLFLLTLWYWAAWIFKRDMPRSRWFLRIAATAGVSSSVITMEAGWVVTEVGRQPWIVYEKMRVEDAATGNTGVWVTFIFVVLLYIALGITTIVVLRRMSRRYREARTAPRRDDDAPYGPSGATGPRAPRAGRSGAREHRRRRRPLHRRHRLRPLRRGRLRRRVLGPHRRRRRTRGPTPFGDRPRHRTGLGGQPRLAHLRLRGAVDELPGGLRLDHRDALRAALDRRLRHRAAGRQLRFPQDGPAHGPATPLRRRVRAVLGDRARTPWAPSSGRSPRVGSRPGAKAGDPWSSWVNPTSVLGGVLAVVVAAYLAAVYLTFDAARLEHGDLVDYFRRRAVGTAIVAGRRAGRGGVRPPRRRRRTSSTA